MKILFINPPSAGGMKMPGPTRAITSTHDFSPPMGLMYIDAYVKKHMDAETRLINFQSPKPPTMEEFESLLIEFKPDVAAISVMSFFWYGARQAALLVKKKLPSTLVVGGGCHMWVFPEESILHGGFDAVVQGEGEITFLRLLERLRSGRSLRGLKGSYFLENGEVVKNPPRPIEKNPDSFPWPDRTNFDKNQYTFSGVSRHPTAVIMTSRGCPHHCTFCDNRDHKFRTRAASSIVDEILECRRLGYKSLSFYDDCFTQSRRHVISLCNEMIARKAAMPFNCRARVDGIDDDLMGLMVRAGCEHISFGVESATQRILDQTKKGINVSQIKKAFALARKHGVSTLGYFILGFPGETLEEAKKTVDLAFELTPDFVHCNALFPPPGTELFEQCAGNSNLDRDYYKNFAEKPVPDFEVATGCDKMTQAQVLKLQHEFYLRFYFRPMKIIRQATRLTSFRDFRAKSRMAFLLLAGK